MLYIHGEVIAAIESDLYGISSWILQLVLGPGGKLLREVEDEGKGDTCAGAELESSSWDCWCWNWNWNWGWCFEGGIDVVLFIYLG